MLALGIDLGGTKTNFGLIEVRKNDFRIVKQNNIISPRDQKILTQVVLENIQKLCVPQTNRIGLALAGQIDLQKQKSICSPNLPILEKIDFVGLIKKEFKLPVYLDNDAHAFVLAEATYGAGLGQGFIAGLTLGTGIGGGIFLNGKIHHGAFTTSGEFGHMIIEQNGRPCTCGQRGCLEAYASATAIIAEYRRRTGFARDSYSIQEEAESNLEPARTIFQEAAQALGVGLVNIVNILEPELIVLGGGLAQIGSLIRRATQIAQDILGPKKGARVKIVPAKLGRESGMIGAALLTPQ